MILAGVLLLAGIIGWIVCGMKSSSDTGKTPFAMAAVLETDDTAPLPRTIESMLGVSVPYNARELAAYGFAGEVTYSASDLDEKRPYSVIRVRPVETSRAAHSEITLVAPELRITSTSDPSYWKQLEAKDGYRGISRLEMLIKAATDQRTTNPAVTAGDSRNKKFNDVDYRMVSYTHKDERFGVTSVRREDCYFTIQHERPYIACVNNIRASNFSAVAQLEQVVAGVSYKKPEIDGLATVDGAAEGAALVDNRLDDKTPEPPKEVPTTGKATEKPGDKKRKEKVVSPYLAATKNVHALAKLAPSTVRTGMIYCADVKLTLPNGKPGPQLTGACVDKGGSGFFVTREGLVATAATSIDVTPREAIRAYITNAPDERQTNSRLERVLQYLFESRILMQTDVDALMAGLAERDQDVIEKIYVLSELIAPERISLAKEKYMYAVQTSDKPITVNKKGDGGLEFAFSNSVFEAELAGKKYDNSKLQQQVANGDIVKDDVALLKVKKGGPFPIVDLAASAAVPGGTTVNVVGMPMYTIGSLFSGQFRPTFLLRQGKVEQAFNGANGQRLSVVGTPSHAGFTGAPAFGDDGQVIGYATYNTANCPNGACTASMIIRDIAEIRSLAKDRNLSIRSVSTASDAWSEGLREMIRGNYRRAIELFGETARQYPQNYLAKPFTEYAQSQLGKPTDTSLMNTGVQISQAVVLLSVIGLILLAIVQLAMKMFSRPQAVSQYGVAAGGQYVDTKSWQPVAQPHTARNFTPAQSVQPAWPGSAPGQSAAVAQVPQPMSAYPSPHPGQTPAVSQPNVHPQQPAYSPSSQPPVTPYVPQPQSAADYYRSLAGQDGASQPQSQLPDVQSSTPESQSPQQQ